MQPSYVTIVMTKWNAQTEQIFEKLENLYLISWELSNFLEILAIRDLA